MVAMEIEFAGLALAVALMSATAPGLAADAAAGKGSAAACAACHEPTDWEGESEASLESLIRDVVRGSVRHSQKISLTEAEVANIAAYWASASR